MSRVHHVGLTVADLDASIDFYCAVLGGVVRERSESYGPDVDTLTGVTGARIATADIALENQVIVELIQYLTPASLPLLQQRNQAGHTHVGFLVASVDAAHDRLVACGAIPTSRPVTINEPGSAWDGVRALYVLDPDGRTIECLETPTPRR